MREVYQGHDNKVLESLKTYCYKLKVHHESLLPTPYLQVVFHGLPECKSQKKKKKPLGNILSSLLPFIEGETKIQRERVTHPRSHRDSEPLTFHQPVKSSRNTITYPVWLMFNIRARS